MSMRGVGNKVDIFAWPVPVSAPVSLLATVEDTGKSVKGILWYREETLGKLVLTATKYYTLK